MTELYLGSGAGVLWCAKDSQSVATIVCVFASVCALANGLWVPVGHSNGIWLSGYCLYRSPKPTIYIHIYYHLYLSIFITIYLASLAFGALGLCASSSCFNSYLRLFINSIGQKSIALHI